MKNVVINSDKIESVEALHKHLKAELDLPDYYGENLDALWDLLTSWVELPISIEWINFGKSQMMLGEYAERILALFQAAERELESFQIQVKK